MNTSFKPAQPIHDQYHAVYVINQGDEKKIRAIVGNITNVLNDPRLKDRLSIHLLAFGDGIEMFLIRNNYEALLQPLKEKDVVFVQCINTLTGRGITQDELYPFVQYVPSANGEIILRQYEGWAIVHP